MKTLIKNGTVVNAAGSSRADVLLEGDRVSQVGRNLRAPGAELVEAEGCYVFPGFIDTHTHFDLDLGYTKTADDFITGTRAALLGGTTTVLDFATQTRGGTLRQALGLWQEKARGSSCNYGFHMALAQWNDKVAAELPEMTRQGITSYKMYLVYDGLKVDDGALYSALKAAKKENALIGVHCENWEVLLRRIPEVKAAGITSPEGHPLSRPDDVEAEAVARYLRIARLAEAPAYIVHLSTLEGLVEAQRARARGQEVYLETCPQYLLLTEERYCQADGAKFVMSPPLRKKEDNEALWNACAQGEIDAIGTDHCSFTMAQKARGKNDFSLTPNGGAGVQHRGQLIYTYGVATGLLTLEQMAELLSRRPAQLFGLRDRGILQPGTAADVVVWDPSAKGCITDDNSAHHCDNSPFAGFSVQGGARDVFLNGRRVVNDWTLVETGTGKYLHRKGYQKLR